MLLAITSEGKLGLGVLAGLFIVFALLSSFYFPRRDPNFPGNRLGLFVLVTVVLFVGTMAGVVFFAKEEEEAHGAEATETHGTETGEQETTPSTTRPRTGTGGARRRATPLRARRSSRRPAAAAATRSRRPARPATSARTSTTPSRRTTSSSSASRTARARCPRSRVSSTSSRSRTSPRTWSSPRRGRAAAIPCAAPGEVSERPKERDWKSRTRRKACRGFKSRPLRWPETGREKFRPVSDGSHGRVRNWPRNARASGVSTR